MDSRESIPEIKNEESLLRVLRRFFREHDGVPLSRRDACDKSPSGGEAEALCAAVVKYIAGFSAGEVSRYHWTLSQVERVLIAYAMKRCGGNQSEAAEYLGLHRNTLRNKLHEFAIAPERNAEAGESPSWRQQDSTGVERPYEIQRQSEH